MTTRESLAVHPLLTPSDPAKYVPYTPRQRPPPTAPPPPPQPAKPQLRAAAQSIGLETTSIGWAILDRISYEGDTSDDWAEIWTALTRARATLLLPAADATPHDAITPEFVLDHLVLCDLAARDNTPLVSLSGLRGHLVHDTLTFRSALHRATKSFQALLAHSTSRAASLDALPPLPAFPLESSYPSFTVSAFTATLPLPPRATKPPLPPRPGVRGAAPASSARLLPFASLFGQRPSTPPPPTTATATATDAEPTIDISAFVINTAISRTDIATIIINALKGEIAVALNDQPPWLVERVHAFAQPFFPLVKLPAGKKKLQDIGGNPNRVVYAVNSTLDKPEELADAFQAFYSIVEGELRRGGREEGQQDSSAEQEEDEGRVRGVLETIESTLCTLLYDRLFLPSTSDDASHNEALSSRVAALNMLDLGLEHLDINIGDADPAEVDAVVRTCGQTLAQLDLARSPREKAAVLVSAHKLVVEGLSKIPPIRLKNDPTEAPGAISIPVPTEPKSPSMPPVHLSTSPDQRSAITVPPLETQPSSTSSPVSGDVLLPILIFSVVKANPSRLVSHLLFTQRFRNQSFGGEEGYCLINLMAVAEFLENVDLAALGLGDSEKKVLSTADLTPIPISISRPNMAGEQPITGAAAAMPSDEQLAILRGRVGLGVDAIAGSANRVISGVVDTSFGVLRAFLPNQPVVARHGTEPAQGMATEADRATWGVRPGLGLLRRETGFSIAGLTAALPVGAARGRGQGHSEEVGQRELVEVSSSRPPSLRSHRSGYEGEVMEEKEVSEGEESGEKGSEEEGEEGVEAAEAEAGENEGEEEGEVHDTRSIKSFESMLNGRRTKRRTGLSQASASASANGTGSAPRRKRLTDLTDRLTHGMAGMSRRVQAGATTGRIPPPNRRFVECAEGDIRVSEVGELLREYQRLVEAVRSAGGFQE